MRRVPGGPGEGARPEGVLFEGAYVRRTWQDSTIGRTTGAMSSRNQSRTEQKSNIFGRVTRWYANLDHPYNPLTIRQTRVGAGERTSECETFVLTVETDQMMMHQSQSATFLAVADSRHQSGPTRTGVPQEAHIEPVWCTHRNRESSTRAQGARSGSD